MRKLAICLGNYRGATGVIAPPHRQQGSPDAYVQPARIGRDGGGLRRALEKAPREICSIATTQRLVQEIAWGVVNGLRDEDALANVALARTNIVATFPT